MFSTIKVKKILQYITVGFAAIPTLIVAIVGFFSMKGFADTTVENYANITGAAQAEIINQCLNEYQNDVNYLANDPTVYDFGKNPSGVDVAPIFKSYIGKGDDILNIVVMSSDGDIIYDYANIQSKGQSFFGFSDIEGDKLSVGQTFLSPIYSSADNYGGEVFFVARYTENSEGNPSAIVAEVISTQRISKLLSNTGFSINSANGYVALSDGGKTVLNFDGSASQKIDSLNNANIMDVFRANAKESGSNISYAAGGYIGSYGYITGASNTGWKWVTVFPGGVGSSQILVPTLIALGGMLLAAGACAVIGLFVTKSIMTPLNTMIDNMRDINEGNHEMRFNIKTHNEFRSISEVFNNMLDEVSMSEELHRTISDISDNMLFEWDFHKEIMFLSDNFKEKFDIDPEVAQLANGKFLDKLMSDADAEQYKRDISTLLKNKTGHSSEYQMRTRTGGVIWFSLRAMCVTDRLGEPLRVIGVVTDIDNEKKLELQLSERASYDFLSQLYNRSTFERELQSELERNASAKVGVLFIDVDDFKFINDRFGHSVGDEVIKYVSNCIKQRVKGTGFAGRFGGDEFVLCVTDPEQIDDIESLSLDLIDELYSGYHSDLANVSINVKASIGISLSPDHGEDGAALVAAADEAMYFVKKNGKANYHIYEPEDSDIEGLQHTL